MAGRAHPHAAAKSTPRPNRVGNQIAGGVNCGTAGLGSCVVREPVAAGQAAYRYSLNSAEHSGAEKPVSGQAGFRNLLPEEAASMMFSPDVIRWL